MKTLKSLLPALLFGAGVATAQVIERGGLYYMIYASGLPESIHDGPVIGTLKTPYTGEWENWSSDSTPVSGATGIRDLYFVFKGGTPFELFRFDSWNFTK